MTQTDTRFRPMAVFFVTATLAFALLYWGLVVLSQRHTLPFGMDSIMGVALTQVLRDFGPAIVAVVSLFLFQGKTGLVGLGRSLMRWRVSPWLYLLALLAPFAVSATQVVIGLVTGTMSVAANQPPLLKHAAAFFLMLLFDGPLGEEIGWRGLLLPALLTNTGPIRASLIVGIIWAAWHIPLYVADGSAMGFGEWTYFFAQTTAYSLVFTWFFVRTRSVFFSIFLHNTTNYAVYTMLMKFFHRVDNAILPRIVGAILIFSLATAAGVSLARSAKARHLRENPV